MEDTKIIKSITKDSKTNKSSNSFKFTPINISFGNNSSLHTNNIEKNIPTYNKSFDLKNSFFNFLKKPETNFEGISSLNFNIGNPSKNKNIKKLKKKNVKKEKKKNIKKEKSKKFSERLKIRTRKIEMKKKIQTKSENSIKTSVKTKTEKNQNQELSEKKPKLNIIGKNSEFESDSEKIYEIPKSQTLPKNLIFSKSSNFKQKQKIPENIEKRLIINFYKFLQDRSNKQDFVKMHKCKFCTSTFKKHTALGGHIAKNHPNKSKSYQKRKKSLEDRMIERKRLLYLKKLE